MSVTRRTLMVAGVSAVALAAAGWWPALAADPAAAAPIQTLNQALLGAMRSGKQTPFSQRFLALAPVVERTFDLAAILKSSVGLRWTSLSAADQEQLLQAFRKFTVASYVANFDNFNGERIELSPESRMVGADQVVGTRLISGGETTPIDYVMHKTPDGWRAVDVLLNGSISQVAVNRSDWRSLLSTGAAPLIDSFQRRTATLSGGTIN